MQGTLALATTAFGALVTGCADSSSSATPAGGSVLLAYFSRPGENYYHGDRIDLAVGNTQVSPG